MSITIKGTLFTGGMSISHNTAPVNPVDELSAGADQIILCSSMVILDGTAIGGLNNAFLWEQTGGTPVTIDDPTSLVTFFLNPGGNDLTFRLYADKGTVNETFDDTNIVRTPTTWSRSVYGDSVSTKETAYDYDLPTWKYFATQRNVTDFVFGPDVSNWPPPNDLQDGLGCPDISVTDLSVTWDLPVDNYPVASQGYIDYWLERFVSVVVEKYNTTSSEWELEAEISGEDGQRFYAIEQNETYRIGTKYDYGLFIPHVQYAASFNVVADGSTLYKTPWENSRSVYGDMVARMQEVKRFTPTSLVVPADESTSIYGDMLPGSYTVERLTAATLVVPDDESTSIYGDMLPGPFLIDRNYGNNIGG